MLRAARRVRANTRQDVMSKHSKIVSVTVDAHAKQKLQSASNSVAELATAVMIGTDDRFGPKGSRKH
jgi:hypothetical protein